MANGDTDTTDQTQVTPTPTPTPSDPTSQQEQDVNQQLFGGKKPDQAETARRAMPVDPETQQKGYYEQWRINKFNEEQEQQQKYESLLKNYYEKILSIKNEAHPEQPKFEKELPMPGSEEDPNRNKQNVGQIFGQVIALATIAATVFGRRHGQWGRAIQQQGIGEFLKAYSAGQHEQAKEQLLNWQKANEAIKEENRRRQDSYNDILKDQHLTLSEQHEGIAMLSQIRQDEKYYQAAASKNLAEIMKGLDNKTRADIATSKAAMKILDTVHRAYFTNPKVRSWVDHLREDHGIDPLASPEKLREAENKYHMSDWVADSKPFDKDTGMKQTESGLPIVRSGSQGNDDYAKLKPGQKFVDDKGNQWVKPDGGQ